MEGTSTLQITYFLLTKFFINKILHRIQVLNYSNKESPIIFNNRAIPPLANNQLITLLFYQFLHDSIRTVFNRHKINPRILTTQIKYLMNNSCRILHKFCCNGLP
jgi:hypothetical protein